MVVHAGFRAEDCGRGLVGFGRIPASTKDSFGETFGSGSAMAVDPKTWTLNADGTYSGSARLVPDRGYNVVGTTDYRERLNVATQGDFVRFYR